MKSISFKFILFCTFSIIQSTSAEDKDKIIAHLENFDMEYQNKELKKFDYFIKDITIKKYLSNSINIIDINGKILPILNTFERKFKEENIPNSKFKEDLTIIGRQFLQLLENGFLLKDIVIHDIKVDPDLRILVMLEKIH